MSPSPKYFMTVFGGKFAASSPVEGGQYELPNKYWPSNFTPYRDIAEGDIMLLYCVRSYLEHPEEMPGVGICCRVEQGVGISIAHYRYLPLVEPIGVNTIRAQLPALFVRSPPFRSPYRMLFNIDASKAQSILKTCQIRWP